MSHAVRTVLRLAAWVAALGGPLLVYQGVNFDADDVLYARLAWDWADGHPTFGINNHPYRLGFLAPMAALYHFFGVQDWATVAFTLFASLASLLLAAFAAARLYGTGAGALAALFCGLHPVLYRSGSIGMPDVPAGFLYGLFVVGWVLIVAERVAQPRAWAVLSGLACAWAVATRESTAPMILLTLAGFAWLGWRRGRGHVVPIKEWVLGSCVVGVPYLAYLWWQTGHPLYMIEAAQGGYNFPGAPWLEPLEGARLAARLIGLSIFRVAIEGYGFAVLPLLVAAALVKQASERGQADTVRLHLLVAVASPLVILNYAAAGVSPWVPVNLDIRFGSPLIIPAAILLAGVSLHLPALKLSGAARAGVTLVMVAAAGSLLFGWRQADDKAMAGAAAAIIAGMVLLASDRLPRYSVPAVLVLLLAGNWCLYFAHEYPALMARERAVRQELELVRSVPPSPILTDEISAQVLSYVHGFDPAVRVVTWKAEGEAARPFYWTERIDGPPKGEHLLLWRPSEAREQAERWKAAVPPWVLQEVGRSRVAGVWGGDPEAGLYLVRAAGGH